MKGGTVQINWHEGQPVLTLDFHSPTGVLATGGNDHDIKVQFFKISLNFIPGSQKDRILIGSYKWVSPEIPKTQQNGCLIWVLS